ncbi:hypothetical protein H4R24_004024, partial [Coemansia sp. RSA 988]
MTTSRTELDADHDALVVSLFTSLSGLLVDVYQQRYIILVDNYDYLLAAIHGMTWEDQARKLYIGILSHMLSNNSNLRKALLVGTHILPLSAGNDGPALDNVLTISHTAYHCNTNNVTKPSPHISYEAALESMFGFTIQETAEFIKLRFKRYSPSHPEVKYNLKDILPYFGGDRSIARRMCCGLFNMIFISSFRHYYPAANLILSYSKVPEIHDTIRAAADTHRDDILLLSTRLIHGYDSDEHSCYIWPSLQEAQIAGHNMENRTRDFVLCQFSLLGTHNAQLDMDGLVTLLLHIGYLTIGDGNTVRVPNGYLRKLWESIRLLALFGTCNQVQQDIERHRLIESLFDRDIGLLCQEFQQVLIPEQKSNNLYSDHTRLEVACKRIIGKIGFP